MAWRPSKVSSKSWEEAAGVYESVHASSLAFEAMRHLCEHIANAPYRELVFCAQSMHALLIAQHAEIERNCGVLRIEVTRDDEVSFSLHEQPFVEPTSFRCTPPDLIATFENFLRKTKWVSETGFRTR
jgi:hypothetical protein